MRWPLQPLQPFQQTQLQPPFGQSVDSLCHPWFTTTNVSYRFPILKLPPPPCAVLLVHSIENWSKSIQVSNLQDTLELSGLEMLRLTLGLQTLPIEMSLCSILGWWSVTNVSSSRLGMHRLPKVESLTGYRDGVGEPDMCWVRLVHDWAVDLCAKPCVLCTVYLYVVWCIPMCM